MRTRGFGYLPDLPSIKDLTPETKDVPSERLEAMDQPPIKRMLRKVGVEKPLEASEEVGETSDLRQWCPPIEDQSNLGSCHDSETEVLTDDGWKLFSDLRGNERLASVDPKNSNLIFESPTRLTKRYYEGDLVCVRGKATDFRVTPDHKMLVRKWDQAKKTLSAEYSLVNAEDLGWYCGLMGSVQWGGENPSDTYTLPGVQHKLKKYRESVDIPMKSWLRFLGVYLADGTMLKRTTQGSDEVTYKIQIAAKKQRKKEYYRKVLSDVGASPLELSDRFTFSNKRIYEAMSSLGLEGVLARDKFVPRFVFKQDADCISALLEGHLEGDGCVSGVSVSHYTGSKRLADDVNTLLFLVGKQSRVYCRENRSAMMADGRVINANGGFEYRVSSCSRQSSSIERKKDVFSESYSGYVYCAEVPTYHTLVTRRNGKILISGNCTAQAAAALIEYFEKRAFGNHVDASRLFIYKASRRLAGLTGDSGSYLRSTMEAITALGAPPEEYWPYKIEKFDDEPDSFCYAFAQNYKAISYYRLDPSGVSGEKLLTRIKTNLAAGLPCMFGFTVYSSFVQADTNGGKFPWPMRRDRITGGHAVVAVGHDDNMQILNSTPGATQKTGALLIRNSWGTNWGEGGYGWLPYDYVRYGLADDFWSVLQASWIDTGQFSL